LSFVSLVSSQFLLTFLSSYYLEVGASGGPFAGMSRLAIENSFRITMTLILAE